VTCSCRYLLHAGTVLVRWLPVGKSVNCLAPSLLCCQPSLLCCQPSLLCCQPLQYPGVVAVQRVYTYLGVRLHDTRGLAYASDAFAASGSKAKHALLTRCRCPNLHPV
jgi:hypothetical protein